MKVEGAQRPGWGLQESATLSEFEVLVLTDDVSTTMADSIILKPACVVIRLLTGDGREGIGCATANLAGGAVGRATADLAALLIRENLLYRERIWQKMFETSIVVYPPQAIAAIDCALWDMAGKAAGMPIYQLLGPYRDTVPSYASTPTYDSTEEYLSAIDECIDFGFRAIKLHAWGDPTRDMLLCEAVRNHVGPDISLMLDALGAYDLSSAVKVGRTLERLSFEWFEMPVRDQSIWAYRQLASALDIAVASGEVHTYGFQEASNYLIAGAWDFIRIDACISGGITGAHKAAALAEGFGVRCEIHSYGHSLAQAVNLQVIGSISNCKYFEVPFPFAQFLIDGVDPIELDRTGHAHVPRSPGIGLNVDWERLRAVATDIYVGNSDAT